MNRKESYKRIKENKDDDFETKLLKREIYKSMQEKNFQRRNFYFTKTPEGKIISWLCAIILILLLIIIYK